MAQATNMHSPGYGAYGAAPAAAAAINPLYDFIVANRVDDVGGKVLHAVHEANAHVSDQLCDGFRKNGDATHDVGEKVLMSVCESGKDSVNATNANGREVLTSVYDSTNNVRDNADRNAINLNDAVHRGFTDVERSEGVTRLSNERNAGEVRSLIDRNNASTVLSQKEGVIENLKGHCETDKLVLDNKFELCKAKDALSYQANENTAAIQLEAFKNKSELARQLAECCCEIKTQAATLHCETKEKIDARARETQLLVRELDTQRVRDELNKVNTDNLIRKLSCNNGNGQGQGSN